VLLITIDTLRADRVASSAPFLTELATKGIRFERAYSTTSWTPPAIASLLTGTYPSRHGVEHGGFLEGGIIDQEIVADDLRLLAQLLQEQGFRTFGITANGHLGPEFGFARGFDRYACVGFSDAPAVQKTLTDWLEEIRTSHPYFLWLHFFDPHTPYKMREPWFSSRRRESDVRYEDLEGVVPALEYARLGVRAKGDRLAYVEALYEAEIAYVDNALREVFTQLGVSADDFVIVTSDHGEEFRDHGGFGHGHTLFEEGIRVPLLFRLPRGLHAGTRVATPVSLVDVLPTILAELDIEVPAEVQGTRLGLDGTNGENKRALVVSELLRFNEIRALIAGRWKLIDLRQPLEARLLFDLEADPSEREVLTVGQPGKLAKLLVALAEHRERSLAMRRSPVRRHALDASQIEALRALGYVD
jgi:arylsulfatase A-like enzyme